jgi:hypothetical protein
MTMLKPCDIMFTSSPTWLSKAIRFCTRSIGEPKSVASHVGMVVAAGIDMAATIVEAQSTTNRHTLQESYGNKADSICVCRPINIDVYQKHQIVAKAESYVGRKYGYLKLGLHLLDWMCGGAYLFRRLGRMDKYPICSYVVASAFKAIKADFGISNYGASPDDMWDFIVKNPDKYEFVWQRGSMFLPK